VGRLARALGRLGHLDAPEQPGPGPRVADADGWHPGGPTADRDNGDGGDDGDPYRLVVIDCPPSLGQLTRSALAAADRAVLVTDPTMFAVSGVQRAFDAVQSERQRGNPDLQPLGVLINRVRPRNAEHEFRVAELRELFGPLVLPGVLPDRSAIQQAQGACMPIQRWDTPGAREASAVFTLLLGRVLRSERPRRAPRVATAPPVPN
jgi:cellulose biosynthesis protein BcsQ